LSRPPSQTWRTFLANHVTAFASMDFFTVSTLTGRLLFAFVILSHDRRRIVHVNCTGTPTSAWTAQQLVEAFPDDTAPGWLLRDRDNVYDEQVRRRIATLGITDPRRVEFAESLAESVRRTGDRLSASGVSESRHRAQRDASTTDRSRVSRLLPSEPHAFSHWVRMYLTGGPRAHGSARSS
jgi:hypothetical protein